MRGSAGSNPSHSGSSALPRGLLLTRTHTSRGRVGVVDNTVAEGNHLWNWNGTYPYPHPKTVEPYLIGVLGSDQDPQPCEPYPHGAKGPCTPSAPAAWQGPINQLVAIQRNRLLNNAGIVVRGHTANVLVEANLIQNSSVTRVHVNATHASHVLVARNGEVVEGVRWGGVVEGPVGSTNVAV